jgi:hypothetical protein
MPSIGQMELWHSKSKARVEKYKALLKEEMTKKKEFGRPKTPQQTKQKEAIVQKITRYRDELDFSKKKEKEWEVQLKEARKEEKQRAPKSAKSVKKALDRKFGQKSKVVQESKSGKGSKQPSVRAKDNRIVLPNKESAVTLEKVFSLLQDVMGKLNQLEHRIEKLDKK